MPIFVDLERIIIHDTSLLYFWIDPKQMSNSYMFLFVFSALILEQIGIAYLVIRELFVKLRLIKIDH